MIKERMFEKNKNLLPIIAFFVNCFVFWGTRLINIGRVHYDLSLSLDAVIPLVPQSLLIYFGCFAFWALCFVWIAKCGERWECFYLAFSIAEAICFITFIIMPTKCSWPIIRGESFWDYGMRFLYSVDSPDNLFPSIHCMLSWLCFIGLRNERRIKKSVKIASCVFALMVCLSTLLTKQHVIVDVFAGGLLAELSYFASTKLLIKHKV